MYAQRSVATAGIVGSDSVSLCSPASRGSAALRPRSAGLKAFDTGCPHARPDWPCRRCALLRPLARTTSCRATVEVAHRDRSTGEPPDPRTAVQGALAAKLRLVIDRGHREVPALGHDPRHRPGLRAQAGAGLQREDARRHRDRAPSSAARSPASARTASGESPTRGPSKKPSARSWCSLHEHGARTARGADPQDLRQRRGRGHQPGTPTGSRGPSAGSGSSSPTLIAMKLGVEKTAATQGTCRHRPRARRGYEGTLRTARRRAPPAGGRAGSKSTNLVRTALDIERVVCGRRGNPTSRLRTCSTETLHRRAGRRRTPDRSPASAERGCARAPA